MRYIIICIIAASVSGCSFEPVLTAVQKNEHIAAPVGYIILMGILILIFFRWQPDPKKKPKH